MIQADLGRPVLICRNIWLFIHPNQGLALAIPSSLTRGVSRSSRTLGTGCDGRESAARRAALMRTAKSCGPGAPTLALSLAERSAERRWQQSPVTGESTKETVKTIARGMLGESSWTCGDYARVLFQFRTRGYGCQLRTRHSLRPCFRGYQSKPRTQSVSRERGLLCICFLTIE
jgi:hypothetical protein